MKIERDPVNESIKELVFDENIMNMDKAEEEEIEHTKNILHSLSSIPKPHLSQVNNKSKSYMDFKQYSLYRNSKYNLLLKASSLFENSILFQNDYLTIQCQTKKNFNSNKIEVVLELRYIAKIQGCYITTNFQKTQKVQIFEEF